LCQGLARENISFKSAESSRGSTPDASRAYQRRDMLYKLLKRSQPIHDRQSVDISNFGFHNDKLDPLDPLEEVENEGMTFTKEYLSNRGARRVLTLDSINMITLPKLVELVTSYTMSNVQFLNILLVTHHAFCDSSQLLELLIKRFLSVKLLRNVTKAEQDHFNEKMGSVYKMKVVNCIKMWLTKHWEDD